MSFPSRALARSEAQMGSTSTLAAVVRVEILSPWGEPAVQILQECNTTHGDLNALVGEDEGGVGSSEFSGLGSACSLAVVSGRAHHRIRKPNLSLGGGRNTLVDGKYGMNKWWSRSIHQLRGCNRWRTARRRASQACARGCGWIVETGSAGTECHIAV